MPRHTETQTPLPSIIYKAKVTSSPLNSACLPRMHVRGWNLGAPKGVLREDVQRTEGAV